MMTAFPQVLKFLCKTGLPADALAYSVNFIFFNSLVTLPQIGAP